MEYRQTLEYLYNTLPIFQKIGGAAFNKGLDKTFQLLKILDNPQQKFKSIHIAGTNGKGSVSSMLSAIFQSAGYKTGLYTSPHLKSFTERIRINGIEIPEEAVVSFVSRMKSSIEEIKPSFFEVTVAMAFDFFASEAVDIAIIEVGMGGRLDSTNVITPELSIITNISFDHQEFLGNTLSQIAGEKAGIIKEGIPVLISEYHQETQNVFKTVAANKNSKIVFADPHYKFQNESLRDGFLIGDLYKNGKLYFSNLKCQLSGFYQIKNIPAVVAASDLLKENFNLSERAIREGIEKVCTLSGLKGRWQTLGTAPLIICDTGHNEAGITSILQQLESIPYKNLHIIIGMVKDKDVSKILQLLPKKGQYYFCQAEIPRAMSALALAELASTAGLYGKVIPDVNKALEEAQINACKEDLIFIGGSTFVVAEINGL